MKLLSKVILVISALGLIGVSAQASDHDDDYDSRYKYCNIVAKIEHKKFFKKYGDAKDYCYDVRGWHGLDYCYVRSYDDKNHEAYFRYYKAFKGKGYYWNEARADAFDEFQVFLEDYGFHRAKYNFHFWYDKDCRR